MSLRSDLQPGIRWWRVLGGGVLIEIALMIASLAAYAMGRMDDLQAVVPLLTIPISFLAGWWVARRAARPVANAALAGAIAIPLYLALVAFALVAAPAEAGGDTSTALSPAYLATHALKVIGAAAGGWWVARRRSKAF
jgi:hypothetical protein